MIIAEMIIAEMIIAAMTLAVMTTAKTVILIVTYAISDHIESIDSFCLAP